MIPDITRYRRYLSIAAPHQDRSPTRDSTVLSADKDALEPTRPDRVYLGLARHWCDVERRKAPTVMAVGLRPDKNNPKSRLTGRGRFESPHASGSRVLQQFGPEVSWGLNVERWTSNIWTCLNLFPKPWKTVCDKEIRISNFSKIRFFIDILYGASHTFQNGADSWLRRPKEPTHQHQYHKVCFRKLLPETTAIIRIDPYSLDKRYDHDASLAQNIFSCTGLCFDSIQIPPHILSVQKSP